MNADKRGYDSCGVKNIALFLIRVHPRYPRANSSLRKAYETNLHLPRFLVNWTLGHLVYVRCCRRREPGRVKPQDGDHYFLSHHRPTLFARLCSISLLAPQATRRLPPGRTFSRSLCAGDQPAGFFDRNFSNRQNFRSG